MANLKEIAVTQEHKNSSDVDDSGNGSSPGQNQGNPKANGNGELKGQTSDLKKPDVESPGEDPPTKFYERYRKEAEECDKKFMKKYEDLDTMLIFAGLFSAVTSAFIIRRDDRLQWRRK